MPQRNEEDEEIKLVVFGSGGVGKSALIVQFIQGVFVEQYDPTLEDSYRKECEQDGHKLILDILDTAGQEEFKTLREQYIRQGDGYMVVYSITNRDSFEEVELFIEQIIQSRDLDDTPSSKSQHHPKLPIVLVGNKADLDQQRKVPTEEGEELARKYGIKFFESSAKSRLHVEDTFHAVARIVYSEKLRRRRRCVIQ
eukprot:gb/GECH01010202.1/.p1 GENE.gb/GECH01010202.1/~~gb/GECH01010202.1/.p1  ORF type:complete len:197 (+),score=35.17 gb/GECH01010202.1/:1-591(+)